MIDRPMAVAHLGDRRSGSAGKRCGMHATPESRLRKRRFPGTVLRQFHGGFADRPIRQLLDNSRWWARSANGFETPKNVPLGRINVSAHPRKLMKGNSMTTIDKLFVRSPFRPLQRHMDQVAKCVAGMEKLLKIVVAGESGDVNGLAAEVSKLEHQADLIKDDIRNQLYRPLFTAVRRERILDMLFIQDNIADTAEDVCVVLTFKSLNLHPPVLSLFSKFRELNINAFDRVKEIIEQLDELVESGFGGAEAERVRIIVHEVAHLEHEADVVQIALMKELFSAEAVISHGDFYLWTRLIRELGEVANQSENLANSIRSTLELK
ncbi:MAG: TIGR00153 family protein [SAR324 cluster bacterium]|nr:TIGR00153 family protein [SAR324 cluster bacterium]